MVNSRNSIFFVTKPLQYFNATNIEDSNYKICIIIDYFFNALEIYHKVKETSKYWDLVLFFQDRKNAFDWINLNKKGIENIYIDSDYGLKNYYYLHKLRSCNIYVYEEGLGNYKGTLRNKGLINYIIKKLYSFLGFQDFIGGSKYTKGIYLYDIERHQEVYKKCNKIRKEFISSFDEHLKNFQDSSILMCNNSSEYIKSLSGKKILIYLTSWNIYPEIDKILVQYDDYYKILKPHPIIREIPSKYEQYFNKILNGNIFIELFINKCIDFSPNIIVIHHNSSVGMYFKNKKNIEFINL